MTNTSNEHGDAVATKEYAAKEHPSETEHLTFKPVEMLQLEGM